jgi:FHS family L-fucose permease-like MFS transporter
MNTPNHKASIVPREYRFAFILLTACFAAWGLANNMTDPLVKVFPRIFTMTALQGALVQFSFYGAYFCFALPAAILIKKTSYKTGVLAGLGLFITGAFLFYPASVSLTYGSFLCALFVLAGGLAILETSANPFIIALGPEETATQRLNLAQAFNPVVSNIGVFLAALFILPNLNIAGDAERLAMKIADPTALREIQSNELAAFMGPYVGMAACMLFLWLAIALTRMPRASDASPRIDLWPTIKRLMSNPHYVFGVIAQFFYVAAQICMWTFTIQYGTEVLGLTVAQSGFYLQASLIVFLLFRFVCTALMRVMRPSKLLLAMAAGGAALCAVAVLSSGQVGLIAIVAVSACMSLMYPTIYGIALKGLGEDTKLGAGGLVMAILGGALLPLLQAGIIDRFGAAVSYLVPLACFGVVLAFARFDLVHPPRTGR